MSRYTKAKDTFVDEINLDEYIDLESNRIAYDQLAHSLDKSLKMVLIFGRPGTGKSLLLSKVYHNKKQQKELYFFDTPVTSKREFFSKLFKVLTKKELPSGSNIDFETFVEYLKNHKGQREIIILLDEAQMYPTEILEEIRILSDSGVIKFVISLHKTDDEDLIAKEHFQSRIWETIELKNATREELKTYVHKKLLKTNQFEMANLIKEKHNALLYKYALGNYRETNKLLYTIFEIYEYYDKNDPSKIDHQRFSTKIIEMAAIKLGYIHV
jgi:Cdc6-like AAA superfamily ATPase